MSIRDKLAQRWLAKLCNTGEFQQVRSNDGKAVDCTCGYSFTSDDEPTTRAKLMIHCFREHPEDARRVILPAPREVFPNSRSDVPRLP